MNKQTEYTSVNPKVEYVVHDERDVIVAVVAHRAIAEVLSKEFGYGWFSDTSRFVGTNKVGQDINRLFDADDRRELDLPPKNVWAVR